MDTSNSPDTPATGSPHRRWGQAAFKTVDLTLNAITTVIGLAIFVGLCWLAGAAIFSGTQRGLLGGLAISLTVFILLVPADRLPRDWRLALTLSCAACWVGLFLI